MTPSLPEKAAVRWQAFFKGPMTNKIFKSVMNSLLYFIALIAVIGWKLGVFVYSGLGLIQLLIVFALISLLVGILRRA